MRNQRESRNVTRSYWYVCAAAVLLLTPVVSANELPFTDVISPLTDFRLMGCVSPVLAFNQFADPATERRLNALGDVLAPGLDADAAWQYFFSTSVATMASLTDKHVLAMYYHPWSDVALLCEWTRPDQAPKITNVELVNGDILRNNRQPELTPLWRRKSPAPPSLGVVVATSDTVRGFLDLYGRRVLLWPSRWQGRLPNLKNAKQIEANQAHVGATFAQSMTAINVFFTEGDFAPVRAAMNRVRQFLVNNQPENVIEMAAETTDESRVILTEAELNWQEASVVAVATDVKNAFIFLAGPDNPEVFACFWFEMSQTGTSLRRVDFLGHTLGFEEVDQIARQAGMKR